MSFHLTNDTGAALTVSLEPWAEDYTLRVGETLVFIPIEPGSDFRFSLTVKGDGFVDLYAEGTCSGAVAVTEHGVEVPCGYQRELTSSNSLRRHARPKP